MRTAGGASRPRRDHAATSVSVGAGMSCDPLSHPGRQPPGSDRGGSERHGTSNPGIAWWWGGWGSNPRPRDYEVSQGPPLTCMIISDLASELRFHRWRAMAPDGPNGPFVGTVWGRCGHGPYAYGAGVRRSRWPRRWRDSMISRCTPRSRSGLTMRRRLGATSVIAVPSGSRPSTSSRRNVIGPTRKPRGPHRDVARNRAWRRAF